MTTEPGTIGVQIAVDGHAREARAPVEETAFIRAAEGIREFGRPRPVRCIRDFAVDIAHTNKACARHRSERARNTLMRSSAERSRVKNARRMGVRFQRYLTPSDFLRSLGELHAYRNEYVGTGLLESLEEARLITPRVRIRLPDLVARRFWLESHPCALKGAIEPDGVRWDAAVAFTKAWHRWGNPTVYGLVAHPLEDPDPEFQEFLEDDALPFQPWRDRRVDVSSDVHPELFDPSNCRAYYSTWQILLAAEVADMGVHFRVNLAEPGKIEAINSALDNGARPVGLTRLSLHPVHAMRAFAEHRNSLDAVVWYAEETDRALAYILKDHGGGRFQLSQEQSARHYAECSTLAAKSVCRFGADASQLIALGRYLCERWAEWNCEGRPRFADAYKSFLAKTISLVRAVGGMGFGDIRDQIGHQGGWHRPILDVIWPDWAEDEKDRVRITLKASFAKSPLGPADGGDLDAFVDFLARNGLEAFFWRLRSFEDHALRGNEFAVEGMKSDLQGLALAVEHLTRVLGGTERQLDAQFKALWSDAAVIACLKRNDVAELGRKPSLLNDWPALSHRFEALRNEGRAGRIAADLTTAYRIRGGAHHAIPTNDHFEIEELFVSLMRAAFLTFREVVLPIATEPNDVVPGVRTTPRR